jgi:hypothetical protein
MWKYGSSCFASKIFQSVLNLSHAWTPPIQPDTNRDGSRLIVACIEIAAAKA